MDIGIAELLRDIIMRFDGFAVMEPDYVRNCVECLEKTGAANAGGSGFNIHDNSCTGTTIGLAHCSRFGLGGGCSGWANMKGFPIQWLIAVSLGRSSRPMACSTPG